jgi:transglutaminase-like putative cysteine protease
MKVTVGDTIYFLVSMIFDDRVRKRGESVKLTARSIAESRDRNGHSVLDLAHDPKAQTARWGEERLGVGEFPSHLPTYTRGSIEEDEARALALVVAHSYAEPTARAAALAAYHAEFRSSSAGQAQTSGD